ncbi:MAG: hypothetical protein ACK4VI_09840 [Alphaproteobacteria bacterium]
MQRPFEGIGDKPPYLMHRHMVVFFAVQEVFGQFCPVRSLTGLEDHLSAS